MRTFVLAGTLALAASIDAHALPSITPSPPPASAAPGTDAIGAKIDALATRTGQLPRDRRAQVAVQLTRLGPAAEGAILARLDHDSPAMATLRSNDASAASAFDAALLHAIGELKTVRALPSLRRAFEQNPDLRVRKAAADGLGKLCELGGDKVLSAHARTGDARAQVAYASLGLCRHTRTADLLATSLATAPESDVAAIAHGLGFLGSTWAWEALGPTRADEGRAVRERCANALVAAYARYTGPAARSAIGKMLRMVDPDAARSLAK